MLQELSDLSMFTGRQGLGKVVVLLLTDFSQDSGNHAVKMATDDREEAKVKTIQPSIVGS